MSVPDRRLAAALLIALDPPTWMMRHSRAVAEIAGWLAARLAARGVEVDRRLAEAAALLHDVDKVLPASAPERALRHGEGSAAWLALRGHPELGSAVANHPVTVLARGPGPTSPAATWEERVVAYADKRAGQRLESMDSRFASWRRRYPDGGDEAAQSLARMRASELEAAVCAAAGTTPERVHRLRWTGPAIRQARAAARREG